MRDRLREDLAAAMKARDRVAITVLRTTLAAIDNAEAVDFSPRETPVTGSHHVAGASAGVGSTDVTRRILSDADIDAVIREQADERRQAAAEYEKLGRIEAADALRHEAALLDRYLPDAPSHHR
jgi:uncharacterized protein YqeY